MISLRMKYDKLVTELHMCQKEAEEEMEEMGIDVDCASMAYEVAGETILEQPLVNEYLKGCGVTDVVGRFADDIHSGV